MIAPIRLPDPQTAEERRRLREARRVVAAALLGQPGEEGAQRRPRIAAWKAWAFALWVVGATGAYAAAMLGWL